MGDAAGQGDAVPVLMAPRDAEDRGLRIARAVALAAALLAAAPLAAQPGGARAAEVEVSAQARLLYERTRDSVAQIRVLLGAGDSASATGTGFVVAEGVLLTNYHVVADKALEPETYRLEFVLPDGRRGPLEIVAVDVVHDLAVVKGDAGGARALALREAPLAKGDKGFSLGYPLNQGLTVVEGTYNGRSEEQYYERFHFTGAINAGMSGGPVVDALGRVFGVNVATHRRGQLVSFLVPAGFARRLLERAAGAAARGPDFREDVGAQLHAHQAEIMGALLTAPPPVQKLDEFSVPAKAGAFMQCGAGTERDAQPYSVDSYFCYTFSSLYIDRQLHTGMVSFRHSILRDRGLGALRFAHLQEIRFGAGRFSESYDRKHHSRWACTDGIVALRGTRAKMALCVRRYRRFEGLYDVTLRIATLGDPAVALQSGLDMEGVAFEAAKTFAARYVEAIRWSR
ncbi:MAG: serine protease [Burkholderiales bacterium]|nr:serine protease [Burkholderiales bacterium]